jgi:hypothetical protein
MGRRSFAVIALAILAAAVAIIWVRIDQSDPAQQAATFAPPRPDQPRGRLPNPRIVVFRPQPPRSPAAERVAVAYLARTYPDNPVREIECRGPVRRSFTCNVFLAPDTPYNPCLNHVSISVERERVVHGTRFADCVRG